MFRVSDSSRPGARLDAASRVSSSGARAVGCRRTLRLRRWLPWLSLGVLGLALAASARALERQPNQTLAFPADPPVVGYTTEPFLNGLRFTDPVAIVTPPGERDRLFVLEQRGRLTVVKNLDAPTRTVVLDLASRVSGGVPTDERGLLGLAFHPGFATNRYFYVFYSTTTNGVAHQRVSRFAMSEEDPNRALPESEHILLSQADDAGNHNGGDLQFGPDGYLYVSLGDEGNQNDAQNNSQRIDKDFFSGVLRLDVDRRPGSLEPNPHPAVFPGAYAVPADNPWVGASSFNGRAVDPAKVRTEFWVVGLRNPWRISFDPATGELWAGDVGGSLREEVNVLQSGRNYGWAYREGTLAGPKAAQAPANFVSEPPVVAYAHGNGPLQGNSITGGLVYRGNRFPGLVGAYLFADYGSGHLWAVRRQPGATPVMERLTSRSGIAAFGRDPRNGDVLLAYQPGDQILRLTFAPDDPNATFPRTLSETGAFRDLDTLTPEAGIVAYEVNTPFWSDGAVKQRWFSLPATNLLIGFQRDEPWSFPSGMVWIKHFEIETTNGVPGSRRRLETRFLVRNPNGVYGVTYRWTNPATNAVLVGEGGLDEDVTIHDAGLVRTQTWHYPSRSECLQCHTPAAGWALGFGTRQLNRDVPLDGAAVAGATTTHQIAALGAAGYFAAAPSESVTLPALAPAEDERWSVEWRVRSWLDANCSSCHRPGGSALGAWDARSQVPLSDTGLIRGLLDNDQGDSENRLVVPGSVAHSMVHRRLLIEGLGRMPPLASSVLDLRSAALLGGWITNQLPTWQSYAEWRLARFGSGDSAPGGEGTDADGDGAVNALEYLTGTDPRDPTDVWAPRIERVAGGVRLQYEHLANRGFRVEWTDDLGRADAWRPVEHPENRFWIAAEATTRTLDQPLADTSRYYRVRVFEP